MLLFAHLGLTLAAGRFVRWVDLAFLALGSILPDIIDKPLGLIVFGTPAMGRTFAHALLFLLVLVTLAVYLNDVRLASVSIGVSAHLILDFMWQTPVILFWPLLGAFPQAPEIGTFSYIQELLYSLRNPMVGLPEVLGLSYLIFLAFESRSAIIARYHRMKDMAATIQTRLKND
ncbi:MAG: metal-dependent hydrolase [Methanotrichaceae archaeon]